MRTDDGQSEQASILASENERLRAEIVSLSKMYVTLLEERKKFKDMAEACKAPQTQAAPPHQDNTAAKRQSEIFAVMAMSLQLTRVPWVMRLQFFKNRHARRLAIALKKRQLIDSEWYKKTYPEVAASGQDPAIFFVTKGIDAGHCPHPAFAIGTGE